MPNLSYCRFRNTLNDLRACGEALSDNAVLSREEAKAAKRLIELCREIADSDPELNIEKDDDEYDRELAAEERTGKPKGF